MKSLRLVIVIVVSTLGLGGCAAVGLTGAAMGAGAFSAGAGAAVQAGKEYTRGGVVLRTFSIPLDELRAAVSDTLAEMELAIVREDVHEGDRRIVAHARDREVEVRLQPVTRTVTRLRVVVAEGRWRKDRATATEIVVQTESAVTDRVARAGRGNGVSSLARGGRR